MNGEQVLATMQSMWTELSQPLGSPSDGILLCPRALPQNGDRSDAACGESEPELVTATRGLRT